jgi:hypothetical protein
MAKLYGREYTKNELLRLIGDISQVAGAKSYILNDGNAKGVHAVDIRTGSGFGFSVLPDRGMDISFAEYNGQPLCWRSSTGELHPSYFEQEGLGWLRGFYGGLLVTCGLTYAGAPCTDEGKELGVHGRVSYTPAKNVWIDGEWQGDDYFIWVQGKVRETSMFGDNIMLTRKIWTKLGESKLYIKDIVENLAFEPVPSMQLYHINIGFPIVDEDSVLISTSTEATPRDADAMVDAKNHYRFLPPTPAFKERVYYHSMKADDDGYAYSAIVNKKFNNGNGFGCYVKYNTNTLPQFVEWKMNGEGTYVVGMEPANCHVEGRHKERLRGTLKMLDPYENCEFNLEIGVLPSIKEIEQFEELIGIINGY